MRHHALAAPGADGDSLLAVACANLAGLTLARSLTRAPRVAIRVALGGKPRGVFWRCWSTDSCCRPWRSRVHSAARVGIFTGRKGVALVGRTGEKFPTVTPDAGGVLAATALLTVVIGLAIGVVSAWQSVAVRVDESLRGRGTTGSLGRFGRGLLVAQVALSMTLLVGAGLFRATLAHLRANDTSLQSQRIVFTRAFREPGDRELLPPDYYRTLVSGLGHMPGADAAALSVYYPTYWAYGRSRPIITTRADGIAT